MALLHEAGASPIFVIDMLKQYWDRVPSWLKNRYSLTTIGFLIWMLAIDQNDFISQWKLSRQLRDLEERRTYYEQAIEETNDRLQELLGDDAKLEKFAREKYLMKKDDEVIFVIVEEPES